MTTTTASMGVPRAVAEMIPGAIAAAGACRIRIQRIPHDGITGYKVYRAKTRAGFDGTYGDDDGGFEELASAILQPASTVAYVDVSLSSQPTDCTLYYRVRGVDSNSPPQAPSPYSNTVVLRYRSDRQEPVPTFPGDLAPSRGLLKNVLAAAQVADSDITAVTWWEIRTAMVAAVEEIEGKVLQQFAEDEWWSILRDPSPEFRGWWEFLSVRNLIPLLGNPGDERMTALATMIDQGIARYVGELFDGETLYLPGSAPKAVSPGRIVRR